eukprot:CAMPEP_0183302390 /NCGR_PEP_ID=MMETSP0160_2-20130417/8184_1 /TAXON_ID=2839 ORGANISM="Odontella Sinensis, Strain Grunow 1884" /NCGR_SAMPLE_ID=MMETSP0160_2 /ASSEMBLY_ACC=CAM_ASM_000250 /LENGTH=613 /DNA_ID=CAMNT_0025465151 /DNA_START=1096 /DNA_END=2937 /DNA_ORIENTATION=+
MKLLLPISALCSLALLGATSPAVLAIDCGNVNTYSCTSYQCVDSAANYTFTYGSSMDGSYNNQAADIYLPDDAVNRGPIPIVVLVHGGYWYNNYKRYDDSCVPPSVCSRMDLLAKDLKQIDGGRVGYVAVNLEYRRASTTYTGSGPGGLPGTFNDLSDGIDALQCVSMTGVQLDLGRIITVGHSAGGHLALWRALQFGIPQEDRDTVNAQTGTEDLTRPSINPIGAVGLAAVSDFFCTNDANECGACDTVSDGTESYSNTASCSAITNFLGTGEYNPYPNLPQVYSPLHMLANANAAATCSLPILVAHGYDDTTVGPGQSLKFEDQATGLNSVSVTSGMTTNEGHFNVIDTASNNWNNEVIPFINSVFANPPSCVDVSEMPSQKPSKSFKPSLRPSNHPSIEPSVKCGNEACDPGESCNSCPEDCISGNTPGAMCGNGICEIGNGESCSNCPDDCNSKNGSPSNRYCCGDDANCNDPRCTAEGNVCEPSPVSSGTYCCGDGFCTGDPFETPGNCAVDCGEGALCSNGIDDDGDGVADCDDPDCVTDPACFTCTTSEEGSCSDGVDNDCDGLTDCDDGDCVQDSACACGSNKATCSLAGDCCSGNCNNGSCKGN